MSDGSADRAHVLPPVPPVHGDQAVASRAVDVPVRVAFEDDLSDRRVIKAVLAVGAGVVFALVVLGWV